MTRTSIFEGNKYTNREGSTYKVVKYVGYREIYIQFMDEYGHEMKVTSDSIRVGNIKNPYFPSVQGVGMIGFGEYKPTEKGKNTRAYTVWKDMLKRCYNHETTGPHPYKGCTVSEEWLVFQNFANWYYLQSPSGEGLQLDKDILYKGNRVYSKTTCALVPAKINTVLVRCDKPNGELPLGVRKVGKRFTSLVRLGSTRKSLGTFDTPEEASQAYIGTKQEYIRKLVLEEFSEVLREDVKEALLNYDFRGEIG